jgi:TM2 domain-containing membrane protein YozV
MEIIDENGNTIPKQESKRVLAGVLGILLGSLGIHKFVLGYTTQGLIILGISLITCGIGTSIIGLIEGIIYLSKSDKEFIYTYQVNKKTWF